MPEAIHQNVSFFMVWNKRGRSPKAVHNTRDRATTEAARLAAKFPGEKFIVLEAVDKVSVAVQPVGSI